MHKYAPEANEGRVSFKVAIESGEFSSSLRDMSLDSDVTGTVIHADDHKANEKVDVEIQEDDKICPGNKGSGEVEIKLSDLKKVGALGQGASGFVEKCFHTLSKTRIALKQIPVESEEHVNK